MCLFDGAWVTFKCGVSVNVGQRVSFAESGRDGRVLFRAPLGEDLRNKGLPRLQGAGPRRCCSQGCAVPAAAGLRGELVMTAGPA